MTPDERQHVHDVFMKIGDMLEPLPDVLQRRIIAGIMASWVGCYERSFHHIATRELLIEFEEALKIAADPDVDTNDTNDAPPLN